MLRVTISLFILGLTLGSGPCLASCGPLLLSYIVGTNKKVAGGLLTYVLFSLARVAVYIILAIGVFFLGRFALEGFLAGLARYLFILGGAFIILLGVLVIWGGYGENNTCAFLKRQFLEHDKKSIVLLGVVVAIVPCAPLLAMLSYLGLVSVKWWQRVLGALFYGIGVFISPLLLLSGLGGLIQRWLKGRQAAILNYICGLVMVILGLQLIGGAF